MRRCSTATILLLLTVCGCVFNTHGNRETGTPRMMTHVRDLRGSVNKQVTLVGTARSGTDSTSTLEMMGGSVELPAYPWPKEFLDRRVTVTGTLFSGGKDAYRLGDVESAEMWSR